MMKAKDYGKAMRSSGNTKGIGGYQGQPPMDVEQRQDAMADSFNRFSPQAAENMYGKAAEGYGQGLNNEGLDRLRQG